MAQKTMYPAMSGSPYTTITAGIGVSDTEISVAELSVLPAAPNICVIYVSSTKWERCIYSAKSNSSGAGTITVARSGDGHASTDGSNGPLEFDSGAKVMRNYTAYDHDLFLDNIADLETRKITSTGVTFENLNTNGDIGTGADQVSQGNHTHSYQPADATLTAIAGLSVASNKLPYATGEDTFDICDFTSLGRSLVGTTTASAARDLIAAASSTTGTQNIYVDKAATGAGTGVDWTNAFTTLAAARDSLPAIINHNVVIYVRKGATAYDESVAFQRVVAGGSITIQGEYYWYGTNSSSKTGKIDLGSSDFGYANRAQIAAGDVVWATKWSGTIGASVPLASIIDTVASVSGTEITLTTNSGTAFNTSWSYKIVNTAILGTITASCNAAITGISCDGTGGSSGVAVAVPGTFVTLSYCHITGTQIKGIYAVAKTTLTNCAIKLTGGTGNCIHTEGAIFKYDKCVISGPVGVRASGSFAIFNTYNHILSGTGTGIWTDGNSFVRSYGGLNEATTPTNPASSSESAYILQG